MCDFKEEEVIDLSWEHIAHLYATQVSLYVSLSLSLSLTHSLSRFLFHCQSISRSLTFSLSLSLFLSLSFSHSGLSGCAAGVQRSLIGTDVWVGGCVCVGVWVCSGRSTGP